jgi:hypothetical protein
VGPLWVQTGENSIFSLKTGSSGVDLPERQCVSDTIIEEGDYDCQQTPASALYPLFKAIFEKCGTPRPDHLPRHQL